MWYWAPVSRGRAQNSSLLTRLFVFSRYIDMVWASAARVPVPFQLTSCERDAFRARALPPRVHALVDGLVDAVGLLVVVLVGRVAEDGAAVAGELVEVVLVQVRVLLGAGLLGRARLALLRLDGDGSSSPSSPSSPAGSEASSDERHHVAATGPPD